MPQLGARVFRGSPLFYGKNIVVSGVLRMLANRPRMPFVGMQSNGCFTQNNGHAWQDGQDPLLIAWGG